MKRIVLKYPIISSLVITAAFLLLSMLIGYLWPLWESAASLFLYEAVHMAVPFLFVVIFGDVGVYAQRGLRKTLAAGGYIVFTQLFLFLTILSLAVGDSETVWRSPVGIAYGIVSVIGVGFREESVFRGIVVNNIAKKYVKDRRGIFITAISSGMIFGLIHMTNIFAGGDLLSVAIQSVVATGTGFYFAAVYLRGGSLWALILIHSLADAASLFDAAFTLNGGDVIDAINNISLMNLAPFFVLSVLGIFLLRRDKCDEIIQRFGEA